MYSILDQMDEQDSIRKQPLITARPRHGVFGPDEQDGQDIIPEGDMSDDDFMLPEAE